MNSTIYAVTNASMPCVVKIGQTSNLERRLKQLFDTNVPSPFECIYAKEVDDANFIESKIHSALASKRVSDKREFFAVDKHEIISLFDLIPGNDITPDKCLDDVAPVVEENLRLRLPNGGEVLEGGSVKELMRQLEDGAYPFPLFAKYQTIIARKNKGWTLEQSFGFDVPPNYVEVDRLVVKQGYTYVPGIPTGDDNKEPVVRHSTKSIYISQKDFADAFNIPTDYVSDKLKLGWDAEKIIAEYNKPGQ